jgi:L-histidine N-alpha-methyltransferase
VVRIADLDMEVFFADGEELLTEISAKFTPARLEAELSKADFVVDAMWGAEEGEFLLTLAHPYC